MDVELKELSARIQNKLPEQISKHEIAFGELTLNVSPNHLLDVGLVLRDSSEFAFTQLMDLCGVDYSTYGAVEWTTEQATAKGFSRGVDPLNKPSSDDASDSIGNSTVNGAKDDRPRFAVVYHLLSMQHNQRVRLKTFLQDDPPIVDSIMSVWASASWYEREAFDLFGILFKGHPDLRRLLTDYGFIGHPFRKDFPLTGHVQMRYDTVKKRVVYEPVTIEPRTLVPRVIRDDHRYFTDLTTDQKLKEQKKDRK